MALDWTGIVVERDFYSEHYLRSVLEDDVKSELAKPSEPILNWAAAKAQFDETPEPEARRACQREWLAGLLTALGYPWQPEERAADDGAIIPVAAEIARATGAPELWLLEAFDPSGALADPLAFPVTPGDAPEDAVIWEDLISDSVFSGPEPPRWVLLFHLGQMVLIDRAKWSDRRLLRFRFEEVFSSRDAEKLFVALAGRD